MVHFFSYSLIFIKVKIPSILPAMADDVPKSTQMSYTQRNILGLRNRTTNGLRNIFEGMIEAYRGDG
jgi:hypothetical protein